MQNNDILAKMVVVIQCLEKKLISEHISLSILSEMKEIIYEEYKKRNLDNHADIFFRYETENKPATHSLSNDLMKLYRELQKEKGGKNAE